MVVARRTIPSALGEGWFGHNRDLETLRKPRVHPHPGIQSQCFPHEIADFLRKPRLTAKDLPWQAQPVKENFFRRGFQERQHASVLMSCTSFLVS
ncbi:hypothetical protein E2C01_007624 [Portunus trituberculatus]|uniref:Uncharacterized protein n=1 Tax=Portunus trituberculatus TaxID=210409 RepID=A0A5B7CZX3_PORTR|nr:hypothetical protein [Portunus trituberculatus]